MKTYVGNRPDGPGSGDVRVNEEGKPSRRLNPRYDLRNHSPDGFEWGYEGSGPAQLALALVADATGDDELATAVYQNFKRKHIAPLQQDHWFLTDWQIKDFVKELQNV